MIGKWNQIKAVARDYSWLMALYSLSSFIQAFPMVSYATLLNTELHVGAGDLAIYYSVIFVPWNFRAIYGLISDSVPILGLRRRPYLVTMYGGVSVCAVVYSQLVQSLSHALIVGVVQNVFFSFSEAVLDAVSIEFIHSLKSTQSPEGRLRASTDIQSGNMTFRTIGSLASVALAGALSSALSPRTLIAASALFPLLSVCVCLAVPVDLSSISAHSPHIFVRTRQFFNYLGDCIRSRRLPREMMGTISPVLLPSVFILLYASSPSSNVAFMHYIYTSLGFSSVELHAIAQCAAIGGLVGTLIFWKAFRRSRDVRTGFVVSVIVSAIAACSRLLIIHVWKSIAFVCIDETVVSVASRLTLMPVQVYASIAASAPENLMFEGFVFGFFASIENWGGTISGLASAGIAGHVTLTELVVISACVSLLPLFALSFVKSQSPSPEECIPTDSCIA